MIPVWVASFWRCPRVRPRHKCAKFNEHSGAIPLCNVGGSGKVDTVVPAATAMNTTPKNRYGHMQDTQLSSILTTLNKVYYSFEYYIEQTSPLIRLFRAVANEANFHGDMSGGSRASLRKTNTTFVEDIYASTGVLLKRPLLPFRDASLLPFHLDLFSIQTCRCLSVRIT
jgi:hypothetical protein